MEDTFLEVQGRVYNGTKNKIVGIRYPSERWSFYCSDIHYILRNIFLFGHAAMTGMDLWIGVCPSVCPSFRQYCWNRLISFFQNFTWCFRGPYVDVRNRNRSFLKASTSGRNYQKWTKKCLSTFKGHKFISFVWKWCKIKVLTVLWYFAKTACLQKSGSQVTAKNALDQSDFSIL